MTKTSSIKNPYFSHDISTRETKEIKKIIHDLGFEGYGLWWAIVEYMHRNELSVGEEYLILDGLHTEKLTKILNEYGLFRIEDNKYVSDRIIRNIEEQETKTKRFKDAVSIRWLMSDYAREYEKIFGAVPQIDDKEIKKLKSLQNRIPDLKNKLPAIFKKLATIKFDVTSGFIPRSNWLLTGNNLEQILNGQYGKLQDVADSKKLEELKKAQKRYTEKIENFDEEKIKTKAQALEWIVRDNINHELQLCHSKLMEKFKITKEELSSYAKAVENG